MAPHNRPTEKPEDKTKAAVEATPEKARQGLRGRPVLMVLIGGLVFAAMAWAVVEQYGESIEEDTSSAKQQTATDPKAVVTPPNQKVIDNTPPAGEKMQPAPADRDPTPQSGTGGDSQSNTPTGTEKTR